MNKFIFFYYLILTHRNIASSTTPIVSSTLANPTRWLETGHIYNNVYKIGGINLTVAHNSEILLPVFQIN